MTSTARWKSRGSTSRSCMLNSRRPKRCPSSTSLPPIKNRSNRSSSTSLSTLAWSTTTPVIISWPKISAMAPSPTTNPTPSLAFFTRTLFKLGKRSLWMSRLSLILLHRKVVMYGHHMVSHTQHCPTSTTMNKFRFKNQIDLCTISR